MPKRRSIGEQLHVGEIDDDELTIVLTDKLPRGAQFRPDEVEYRTMSDVNSPYLEVSQRQDHRRGGICGPQCPLTFRERSQLR